MNNVWCVRAEFGAYTEHFVKGGYMAIDYDMDADLSAVTTREEIATIYRSTHPSELSKIVIGQQAGQIARFLFEIQAGDYVINPAADTEWLQYGQVAPDPSYSYGAGNDGCPYRHRRRVKWSPKQLKRGDFSVPFQNTIRSSLTVFSISQREEFLEAIGQVDLAAKPITIKYDPYIAVLEQVLQLDDKEFEILVAH